MKSTPRPVTRVSELTDRKPVVTTVGDIEVVLVRLGDEVCALQGRCPHRGASLACAEVEGRSLICKEHGWDFLIESGASQYVPGELLARFSVQIEGDAVHLDEDELRAWQADYAPLFDGDWRLDL